MRGLYSRRQLLRAGGASLIFVLAGCGGQAAASASAKPAAPSEAAKPAASGAAKPSGGVVKAGWVARTAGQTLWPLAKEAGYFDKYGLNVDLQFIENSTLAIPAMVSGELGPVAMAGAAVVGAQAAGSDIVMIAGLQNTSIFRIWPCPTSTASRTTTTAFL